jgi:hypothetical protein
MKSTELSVTCEADDCLATQELPAFYDNPMLVPMCKLAPILNRINPVHIMAIHFNKIHFYIILTSTTMSS